MSKDDSLRDLIERVESASEGSRKLDHAIADAVLGKVKAPYVRGHCEKYSTSIDAAMTLIPEKAMCDGGWRVEYHHDLKRRCHATVWLHEDAEPGDGWFTGWGTTPALALCCASLRAHMGTGG